MLLDLAIALVMAAAFRRRKSAPVVEMVLVRPGEPVCCQHDASA